MSLLLSSPPSIPLRGLNKHKPVDLMPALPKRVRFMKGFRVNAFLFNPTEDPLVKEALKEPVAFVGGMFAGLLRLDLNDDPLRDWLTRTVEAAGITEEEIDGDGSKPEEEIPEQIEIE